MVKAEKLQRKQNYFDRMKSYLTQYNRIIIANVDNVRSNQLQQVRIALRGRAEILMGKNTMMRKCVEMTENADWEELLPHFKGNVGLIFTNEDLIEIRDVLREYRMNAPARVGAIAQDDVTIPKGVTAMDAQKTSFFQALNITTKITKGSIEIVSDVSLLKEGDRVGPSEAALLNMLGISPFKYGVEPVMIYDQGSLYRPKVLNLTTDMILGKFMMGVSNVAAVSLACGLPNRASVPHMVINGYKNVLAVALATEISFPLAEKAKAFLADPSAFVVAAPAGGNTGGDAKAAEPEPEAEESEDEDMDGFSLFD